MREILFRGKTHKGEWVYGNYAFTDNDGKQHFIFQNKALEYKVIPETVGQYTGIDDNNGRKIFDGDIVKMLYKDDLAEVGPIKWSDVGLRYKFASLDGTSYSFDCTASLVVIGNIHDNPELLEVD